jgi:ectoine hydroxylase-related dioxygenase (phytanoyl-CoA dioxygenase family)
VGRELIEVGFSVLPGLQDLALADRARADYYEYLQSHSEKAKMNRDIAGRQFRLTNFHIYSDAAMGLAKNEEVMRLLDLLFGREAAVHTSLTFQYSTMQALHRDGPYFHTFPESLFFGVWTALQDIDPESGPLCYVPGSHRIEIDQWDIYNKELAKGLDPDTAQRSALHIYQSRITQRGEAFAPRAYAVLKKGDVAIWHPQLIHGGSPARKPELQRHSMVAHCCPIDTYVFVDKIFFQHQEVTAPPPYYSFTETLGRKHADFVMPDFMGSI